MQTRTASWYLLYTKPRSEEKARIHLQEQNYEVYLPLLNAYKTRQSKRVIISEVLFPSYLFIQLDQENDNWAPIRSTPGVNNLVRFGLSPAKVPDHFIAALKSNENASGVQDIEPQPIQQGDKVLLLDGALAGMEAIYCASKGQDRALIMLNILGNLTKIELDANRLEQI